MKSGLIGKKSLMIGKGDERKLPKKRSSSRVSLAEAREADGLLKRKDHMTLE